MSNTINPHFLMARRRAERYERLALSCPAYARKRRAPKVRIGAGRYPGQPIKLMPAIHTPPPAPGRWTGRALYAACAVAVVLAVVFVEW